MSDAQYTSHKQHSPVIAKVWDISPQPTISLAKLMRIQLVDPVSAGISMKQLQKWHVQSGFTLEHDTQNLLFQQHGSSDGGITPLLCPYTTQLSISITKGPVPCNYDQASLCKQDQSLILKSCISTFKYTMLFTHFGYKCLLSIFQVSFYSTTGAICQQSNLQ